MTTTTNGQVRKTLASQLDRLDSILDGLSDGTYFYFVHSYHVVVEDKEDVVAETEYGIRYPSVCARGSVAGVQFHPEKSQDAGLRLLANFAGPTSVR